jgi:hypothetical protein
MKVTKSGWSTRVQAYATALGLSYVCNSRKTECESELLPGYTDRATDFEKAVGVSAAYSIYSGAAHAELYAVMQGWRDAGPPHPPGRLLERRPDREAVWTSVIIAAGFVMIPAFEALCRLDWKARKKQAADSMRKNRELARRMNLPQWSW